jgi:uncharacterized protein
MMLPDTNVLVYAFNVNAPRHSEYKAWVQAMVNGVEPYAACDLTLSGLVRLVTNSRIFDPPASTDSALAFAGAIRNQPHCHVVSADQRFWPIFDELCRKAEVRGKLVPDAHLAAIAIENGCELITADRDFRRFPGLRWRHPLD